MKQVDSNGVLPPRAELRSSSGKMINGDYVRENASRVPPPAPQPTAGQGVEAHIGTEDAVASVAAQRRTASIAGPALSRLAAASAAGVNATFTDDEKRILRGANLNPDPRLKPAGVRLGDVLDVHVSAVGRARLAGDQIAMYGRCIRESRSQEDIAAERRRIETERDEVNKRAEKRLAELESEQDHRRHNESLLQLNLAEPGLIARELSVYGLVDVEAVREWVGASTPG